MLDQIVYTRCYPSRDINNNGNVKRGDGFGVFSMSRELFDDATKEELQSISSRLAPPNASKENAAPGLLNSYEFWTFQGEDQVLIYEFERPLCKVPRKNGRKCSRS